MSTRTASEDEPKMSDFNEQQVIAMLGRSPSNSVVRRWVSKGISVGKGYTLNIKLNWVVSAIAILITWGFSILTLADKDNAPTYFAAGKLWVSTNFTWLYIRTCVRAHPFLTCRVCARPHCAYTPRAWLPISRSDSGRVVLDAHLPGLLPLRLHQARQGR